MKAEARVVAFDDGPFSFGDARAPVAAVVTRGAWYVEGMFRTSVAVDGEDATERLGDALLSSRFAHEVRLVFLDGVTYGGFNVVDLEELHRRVGVPVLSVYPGVPDLEAMRGAMERHVPGWRRKWEVLGRARFSVLETGEGPLAWSAAGLTGEEVPRVLAQYTVLGYRPEALRLAGMVARVG